MLSDFYKDDPQNTIYRVDDLDRRGPLLFSFDKIHILNLWTDYPYKFTDEQKEIFDKEYPFWAEFFRYRTNS